MDDLIKNDIEQPYQELFDYLANELNVIATQTQMQEIEAIMLSKHQQLFKGRT